MSISMKRGVCVIGRRAWMVALLLALLLLPALAEANVTLVSRYVAVAPTIDGVIAEGEWGNDTTVLLNGFDTPAYEKLATLYVMNDSSYLYLCVDISDTTSDTQDYLFYGFDSGADHVAADGGEDMLSFFYTAADTDSVWQGATGWVADAQRNGTVAWSYDSGGNYVYEARKPLNSGDSYDMTLAPGDNVGYRIETWDETLQDWFRWPANTQDTPATAWADTPWANLIIGETLPANDYAPNTWYVNDTDLAGDSWCTAMGHDANAGTSPAAPKATLSAVAALLSPGDTVCIDAGTYYDTAVIDTDNITIVGVDSATTIIDGADSSNPGAYGIYANGINDLTIRNLTVRNSYRGIGLVAVDSATIDSVTVSGNAFNGVDADTGSHGLILQGVTARENGNYGFFLSRSAWVTATVCLADSNGVYGFLYSDVNGGALDSCRGERNGVYGIYLDSTTAVVLDGCRITENLSHGVYFSTASTANRLQDCWSYGNLSSGFFFDVNSDDNELDNDTASENGASGFSFASSSGNRLTRNYSSANDQYGFVFDNSDNCQARQNTAIANTLGCVYLAGTSSADTFAKNVFLVAAASPDSGVYNTTGNSFTFARNWWGTTDSAAIAGVITNFGLGQVEYMPYRLGIVDTADLADTIAPNAPSNLTATGTSAVSYTLTWTAPTTNEEVGSALTDLAGYRVYRSTTPDPDSWGAAIAELSNGDTQYEDTTVVAGYSYYYWMTAFDNAAPWENESWLSVDTAAGLPGELSLAIDFTSDSLAVTASTYVLTGSVIYDHNDTPGYVTLSLNNGADSGLFVDSSTGRFSTVLDLNKGPNSIRVDAADSSGVVLAVGAELVNLSYVDAIYQGDDVSFALSDTAGGIAAVQLAASESGTISVTDPTGGETFVIEVDFIRAGYQVTVELLDETSVANMYAPGAGGISDFALTDHLIYHFTVIDSNGADASDSNGVYNGVTLTWRYAVPALSEDELHVYYFDTADSTWQNAGSVAGLAIGWPDGGAAGERQDTSEDTISLRVAHLSTWGIFIGSPTPAANNNDVTIYPNPYMPNDGDAGSGLPFTGANDGSGIYITSIAAGTKVEVYDIRGRLIDEFEVPVGAGRVQWDARNKRGENVVTGVYFVVFKKDNDIVTRKLFIVR